MSDKDKRQVVALIGMMGAGKTTVGYLLASELGWRYYDNDGEIEGLTGKTVAEIFRTDGEPAFRELEAQSVLDAIALEEPVVLSVGGGAVLREETRKALEDHAWVVWLRAPVETLVKRVVSRKLDRPLISEDPEGEMRKLYVEREPVYASVADQTVDVDGVEPAEIAKIIAEALA